MELLQFDSANEGLSWGIRKDRDFKLIYNRSDYGFKFFIVLGDQRKANGKPTVPSPDFPD
jgi:hypothetical protein